MTTLKSLNILKPYGVLAIKSRNNKMGNYTRLKSKVFLQMLLITVAAAVIVYLLRYMLMGQIANRIVDFLVYAFRFSSSDAQTIYQNVIRNNRDVILFIAILIFLLILFRFSVSSWLTKYFDEISAAIDQLVEEAERDIALSPEMDFMENRLNTIKRKLEKRTKDAQEADQRKNDAVVYLAHDIKTPLTSIIGYLSLLDEAPDMPPEQKAKYVGITLEKAYRLEGLVDEFFEITRFNLQSIVLSKGKINLSFMLQQISDEFYPVVTMQGKKIVVDAPDGLFLSGDADKLSRVFNNILNNAIAYSYNDSTLYIQAEREAERIMITFTNNGASIPAEKLETIFEKFFRLDDARSSQTGRAGLGLAIAKEIVGAHAGTITAQSDKSKTSFTVTLPIGDI